MIYFPEGKIYTEPRTVDRWETVGNLGLCVDCVIMIANGDSSGFPSEEALAEWERGFTAMWPADEGWAVHLACPENCDPWFSWQACDGCGSNLGGDRHPGVAMRPRKRTTVR